MERTIAYGRNGRLAPLWLPVLIVIPTGEAGSLLRCAVAKVVNASLVGAAVVKIILSMPGMRSTSEAWPMSARIAAARQPFDRPR
jgi:hypothetical protein